MLKNPVQSTTKVLKKGAENAIRPEVWATVGGFASSRIIETTMYSGFRNVFGDNSVEGGLTPAQRQARIVGKISAAVIIGGLVVPSRNRMWQGAGVGAVSGLLWHTLNDFGINV